MSEAGRSWARKISGLDPPEVRPLHIVEDLGRLPTDLAVMFLKDIQEALVCGEDDAAQFMMALQEALVLGLISYERLSLLYQGAAEAGADSIQRLLLAPRPRRKDTLPSAPKRADGPDTLGMRTWKARTASGPTLDKLVLDTDPRVVRNVLINPRLIERDVLRMVNRRPVPADVLREVAASARWNRRHAVQCALVFNPYTPTEMALRFLPFMRGPDLRRLSQDGSVHPQVSSQAAQYRELRPPGIPPEADEEAMNDDREY